MLRRLHKASVHAASPGIQFIATGDDRAGKSGLVQRAVPTRLGLFASGHYQSLQYNENVIETVFIMFWN